MAAVAVGVGWGVGQLLNDLVDVDADAVDAPDRPAVRGLLPEGPTALVAVAIGVAVTVALSLSHSLGWLLAMVSAALMLAYSPAKGLPALGNLTHGALMAWLCLIGASVAMPQSISSTWLGSRGRRSPALAPWLRCTCRATTRRIAPATRGRATARWRRCSASAAAPCRGCRWPWRSTRSRGAPGWSRAPPRWGCGRSRRRSLLGSVGRSALGGDGASALSGYRFTVHSTAAGLIALTPAALGASGAVVFLAVATLLIEIAFWLSPNP